jgi:hypothetical protein
MSGLLNKVKDLASNNNNTGNSGATDPNATSGGPDGTQTQGSGFDGKIDSGAYHLYELGKDWGLANGM